MPTFDEVILIFLIVLSIYGGVHLNRAGDMLGLLIRRVLRGKRNS